MFQQLARGVRLLKTRAVLEGESIAEFSQLPLSLSPRVREGLWITLCRQCGRQSLRLKQSKKRGGCDGSSSTCCCSHYTSLTQLGRPTSAFPAGEEAPFFTFLT